MNPIFLSIEEILEIHKNQIKLYGGLKGPRDLNLLESALSMPQATFEGEYLHKDLYDMGSAYLYHIVQNHPFVDGNKRVGVVAALVFLIYNNITPEYNKEDLYNLVMETAQGNKTKEEISKFLRETKISD